MIAMRADAGRGWGWIVEGWRLFAKSPVIWVMIMLIYMSIIVALSFFPYVGRLVNALLIPVLVGGMLYGAATQANGGKLQVLHLFRGFQDQDRTGPLLLLGAIGIGGYLLMGLVILLFMGGTLATGMMMDSTGMAVTPQTLVSLLAGAGLVALLVVLILVFLVAAAWFYGVPLVMLAGQNAWPAVQDSLVAGWSNILPLLVFGLISLILMLLALIPLGLGFLIWGPVMICATYASYREVFERPATPSIKLSK